jgi:TPR repeat protein
MIIRLVFICLIPFFFNHALANEGILKKVKDGEAYSLYEYGKKLYFKDPSKAMDLMMLSALQNNIQALNYLKSHDDIDGDIKIFLKDRIPKIRINQSNINYLQKLGSEDDSFAQYQLWLLYINGEFIPKPKAYVWLKKASGNKYPDALYSLGILYYYGFIVPEQESKALRLLEESSGLGSSNAQFFLDNLEKFKHLNKSLIDIII